jgi:hypothetical protein
MKPAVLCLLLLSACSDLTDVRNYSVYRLTWTCVSPEGCERTDQVALIDHARIIDRSDFIDFTSTRDGGFREDAQFVPSDSLPPECTWLYGLVLFAHELEPFRFCRISGGFELEPSIPNQDSATSSRWFVKGLEFDP